jgi:hypothetical protein
MTMSDGAATGIARKLGMIARTVFFCTVCILAMWAMLASRFVPTALGAKVAVLGAIALGMIGAWLGYTGYAKPGSPEYEELVSRSPYMAQPLARAALSGLGLFAFGYLAIGGGVLEFWTVGWGRPGEITMHLGDYSSSSRYNCGGYDLIEQPVMSKRVVCTARLSNDDAFQGAPVALRGMVSQFGVDVAAFEIQTQTSP